MAIKAIFLPDRYLMAIASSPSTANSAEEPEKIQINDTRGELLSLSHMSSVKPTILLWVVYLLN